MLLPLGTLLAYPMYQLVALQCGVMRIYAIPGIALMVPLMQQGMLLLLKCWLLGTLGVAAAGVGTPTAVGNLVCYLSLPLMFAVWTLPVSPEAAAGKCLFRCLGILAVIPVSCYYWCFGGKRVVLAQLSALTI